MSADEHHVSAAGSFVRPSCASRTPCAIGTFPPSFSFVSLRSSEQGQVRCVNGKLKLKLGLATPGEKGKTTTVRSDCSLIEARFTFVNLKVLFMTTYAVGGRASNATRAAGSVGCIGGSYLGQDTVGPPGGGPINC